MDFNYEKYAQKINNEKSAELLLNAISKNCVKIGRPVIVMEVCGTHTHEIFKSGVRQLLPANLKLKSGPGCPVCVTDNEYIDGAVVLAQSPDNIILTFGDMLKVTGSFSSLSLAKSGGADIRIIYSPLDSIKIANDNPEKNIIFLSVGFETTAAHTAFLVKEAAQSGITNIYIYEGNKTVPEALKLIAFHPDVKIDGFLLPGHVSAVTGVDYYRPALTECKIPSIICGFEYIDILYSLASLTEMIAAGKNEIRNEYFRVVSEHGNKKAQELISEVFEPCGANWRGLGLLNNSGLALKPKYKNFSAAFKFSELLSRRYEHKFKNTPAIENCRCGDVLLSIITPAECPLFGNECTPENAIGPCMVSSEGTCAAFYKYAQN